MKKNHLFKSIWSARVMDQWQYTDFNVLMEVIEQNKNKHLRAEIVMNDVNLMM